MNTPLYSVLPWVSLGDEVGRRLYVDWIALDNSNAVCVSSDWTVLVCDWGGGLEWAIGLVFAWLDFPTLLEAFSVVVVVFGGDWFGRVDLTIGVVFASVVGLIGVVFVAWNISWRLIRSSSMI